VERIFDLFAHFGAGGYGEDLSLQDHMLQSAALALRENAPPPLVIAALLHDIGYFLSPGSETSIEEGRNIEHEAVGAVWLSQAFGPDVTAPVALHVQAKRYLCAVEPGYHARLSEASRLSLATQGGLMQDAEIAQFERDPAFEAALALRRWDDEGKDTSLAPQPLEDFRNILTASIRR
jgi:gamma-butyrobetaine dioxygenase